MVGVADTTGEYGDADSVTMRADSDVPLSTLVVEAVAEATGVDSVDLGYELHDAFDGDGLDTMHRHAQQMGSTWELSFTAVGQEVVVTSDGTVVVA